MTGIAGKRILLVEDEFIVAAMVEDILRDFGAEVVGPAHTLPNGLALAKAEALDGAVLDVNLNGARSDPIAVALEARAIPFILTTGYGGAESDRGAPVLDKPYTVERLVAALAEVMAPGRRA